MNNYTTRNTWADTPAQIEDFLGHVYGARNIASLCNRFHCGKLMDAFTWRSSPQGEDFWHRYYNGAEIDDSYSREIKRIHEIVTTHKDPAFVNRFEEVYDPSDYDDNCI